MYLTAAEQEIYRVSRSSSDTGHDGYENVLLDGEWSRVELDAEHRDVWQELCPGTTDGEGNKLGHDLRAAFR